jgi:hypothetical protein
MGKLISIDGDWSTYEYYPDYFSHESEFGIFRVKPATLLLESESEYEIVTRPNKIPLWYNRPDEYVVFALMSKIRKSATAGNLFPDVVYHNA